jgi:hypothetical protein
MASQWLHNGFTRGERTDTHNVKNSEKNVRNPRKEEKGEPIVMFFFAVVHSAQSFSISKKKTDPPPPAKATVGCSWRSSKRN